MKTIIVKGLPGAGKTTYAKNLNGFYIPEDICDFKTETVHENFLDKIIPRNTKKKDFVFDNYLISTKEDNSNGDGAVSNLVPDLAQKVKCDIHIHFLVADLPTMVESREWWEKDIKEKGIVTVKKETTHALREEIRYLNRLLNESAVKEIVYIKRVGKKYLKSNEYDILNNILNIGV